MKKQIFIVLFTIFAAAGCEKSDPIAAVPLPAPPSFSGYWVDVANDISFSMIETDYQLNGAGVFGGLALVASGTMHYPGISLTLERKGYYPVDLQGTFVHADTVECFLNGSGFYNKRIVVMRR